MDQSIRTNQTTRTSKTPRTSQSTKERGRPLEPVQERTSQTNKSNQRARRKADAVYVPRGTLSGGFTPVTMPTRPNTGMGGGLFWPEQNQDSCGLSVLGYQFLPGLRVSGSPDRPAAQAPRGPLLLPGMGDLLKENEV
ncbi:unnamed protein product [Arctogadus glacialis]